MKPPPIVLCSTATRHRAPRPLPMTASSVRPATKRNPFATRTAPAPADAIARTSEYSIFGLARAVDESVMRERRIGFTLILFGVATLIAGLYAAERYAYGRFVGEAISLRKLIPVELIFTYAWALLTPPVMFVAKRFPVWGQARQLRNWGAQVAALAAFVVTHAAICSLVMAAIAPGTAFHEFPTLFGSTVLSWTVVDAIVFCALVTVHHTL